MAQHICASSYGFAVHTSNCENVPASFQECNTDGCEVPYYTYSAWSPCSEECGGGEKTRVATCNSANGDAVAESECTIRDILPLETSKPCNSKPCEAFNWKVTSWGECDAICGGQRMREVSCVYVSGSSNMKYDRWSLSHAQRGILTECSHLKYIGLCSNLMKPDEFVTDASKCTAKIPAMAQACEPCGFCEDVRLNENCSDNGVCENGECVCNEGRGGAICDVDTSVCQSGVNDRFEECCTTGVLNKYGQCCLQTGMLSKTKCFPEVTLTFTKAYELTRNDCKQVMQHQALTKTVNAVLLDIRISVESCLLYTSPSPRD